MLYFLIGLLLLLLLLALRGQIERLDPKSAAERLRRAGGMAAIAGAITLLALGRWAVAVPLALLGMSLLGWRLVIQTPQGQGGSPGNSGAKVSSVRTAYLEVRLDHASGKMDGQVLKGAFAGRNLSSLSLSELLALLAEAGPRDPQSARLIEAFLDQTAPDWRASATGEAGGKAGMTAAEAYEILGLSPGASEEQIRRAHRELIKKFHPDQGGSTYLAMKINQAKETLLRRSA